MATIKDVWGELDSDGGGMVTYRPALVRQTEDVAELVDELRAGFGSRRDLVEWEQRLTVRTFGQVPTRWYTGLARSFTRDREQTLVAAFLQPGARSGDRDINERAAKRLRERFVTQVVAPAHRRAFRHLRKDAGEYIEDARSGEHDPFKQEHVAMRPALEELEDWQVRCLELLLEGFEDESEIHDWGQTLQLATHGELSDEFVMRCAREQSTRRLLLDEYPHAARAREAFAARFLVPAYNAGVRVLAGRAGELPEAQADDSEPLTYE